MVKVRVRRRVCGDRVVQEVESKKKGNRERVRERKGQNETYLVEVEDKVKLTDIIEERV